MKEGIQSNIAQVNKYLERLMKFDKDCAIVVIRDLAAAILRDRGVDFQTG